MHQNANSLVANGTWGGGGREGRKRKRKEGREKTRRKEILIRMGILIIVLGNLPLFFDALAD